MPQDSMLYALSRTRVLENRLLTTERLQRLAEAPSARDVLRLLNEYGYGGTAQETDAQKLVDHELYLTYDYMRRVTPNEYATGILLLKGDCHNIKSILKAKLLGHDAKPFLRDYGTIDAKILYERLQENDASLLSEHMKAAAGTVLEHIELGQAQVQWMECLLDAACFADMADYAKKSGESIAVTFVQTQADLLNLVTLYRVRGAQSGANTLKRALLPGGTADTEKYTLAYEMGDESLLSYLGLQNYQAALEPGLDALIKTGSFGLLERLCDDVLLKLLRDKRYARESAAPLLGYLLAKEREAQAVRLVFAGKRNNVPAAMIQERLRELYA